MLRLQAFLVALIDIAALFFGQALDPQPALFFRQSPDIVQQAVRRVIAGKRTISGKSENQWPELFHILEEHDNSDEFPVWPKDTLVIGHRWGKINIGGRLDAGNSLLSSELRYPWPSRRPAPGGLAQSQIALSIRKLEIYACWSFLNPRQAIWRQNPANTMLTARTSNSIQK